MTACCVGPMGHRTSKFLTHVVYQEGVTEEDCVRIFNYFDTDKDGKLNYNESKRFAQKLFKYNEDLWQETFDTEEAFVAATMKYLDINNDGELGWDEMERQRRARLITSQKNKKYDPELVFAKVSKNVLAAVADTSTAIDLPRLSSKIAVVHEGKVLCSNEKEDRLDPGAPRMKQVLLALAVAFDLDPEVSTFIRDYDLASDFPRNVDGMFELLQANGGQQVLGVLKACTQTCVAPPACALKALLRGILQYRDHRGSWTIVIRVDSSEVSICHTKKETSVKSTDEPGPEVDMQWSLLVRFSRPVWNVVTVLFRVDQLDFNHLVLEEKRKLIISTLGELYGPTSTFDSCSNSSSISSPSSIPKGNLNTTSLLSRSFTSSSSNLSLGATKSWAEIVSTCTPSVSTSAP